MGDDPYDERKPRPSGRGAVTDDPVDEMMPPPKPDQFDEEWVDYMQENKNPLPHGCWIVPGIAISTVMWVVILLWIFL